MVANNVGSRREVVRYAFEFLIKKVKPVEILTRLQAQYGEQTMPRTTAYEWCQQGRTRNGAQMNRTNPFVQLQ